MWPCSGRCTAQASAAEQEEPLKERNPRPEEQTEDFVINLTATIAALEEKPRFADLLPKAKGVLIAPGGAFTQ